MTEHGPPTSPTSPVTARALCHQRAILRASGYWEGHSSGSQPRNNILTAVVSNMLTKNISGKAWGAGVVEVVPQELQEGFVCGEELDLVKHVLYAPTDGYIVHMASATPKRGQA